MFIAFPIPYSPVVGIKLIATPWTDANLLQADDITAEQVRQESGGFLCCPNSDFDSTLALWQEYEDAASPEAKAVKALDKLETILQHNQGRHPPGFDYAFNLSYGQKHTNTAPLFALIRGVLDDGTRERMAEAESLRPSSLDQPPIAGA